MHPNPYQNLHWYPLTSSKNIWPKISVAYFKKWFQPIFTVGGWRIYRPFNFRLLAPAYKPTQSCKRASFWRLNPARARNHKPKPSSSPTFIFEARFRPESQPRELRYAQLQSNKKRCFADIVAGTRFITPKITTTLTKTLAWSGTNVAC